MKKRTYFIIILLVLIVSCFLGYTYLYKAHRDISSETAEVEIEAKTLYNDFTTTNSNTLYLNKTILVKGKITDLDDEGITINNSVYAMLTKVKTLQLNSTVNIKGRCIGYDELLDVVKLDQCSIIK